MLQLQNHFAPILIISKCSQFISKFAILCIFISFTVSATPTLKDYGSLAEIQHVAVSPSGNLIAFRKVTEQHDRVIIVSLITQKQEFAFDVGVMNPDSIQFINERQLILIASTLTKVQGYKSKIDKSTAYLCDLESKAIRQLLFPGDGLIFIGQSGLGKILGFSPDGKFAYMPAFVEDNDSPKPDYSLLKVDLTDKTNISVASKGTKNTVDFFLDAQGNVLAQESYENRSNTHKIRVRQNKKWLDIYNEKVPLPEKEFIGLTPDFKSLVLLDTNPDTGRTAYYTMQLANGSITGPIFGRSDADVEQVIYGRQRVVAGVRYSGFIPSYQFFDLALNKRINNILGNFPEESVYLADYDPDFKNLVVNVAGSSSASNYYLFTGTKKPRYLTSSRPQIKNDDINPIGTVTFAARDGLRIPTLLTIPKDKVDTMKNLPTVIIPHGGPASYDTIGFDWMAQALASHGYLVIQPQFRGSSGFGLEHELAGRGEWGKKMQDDLSDTLAFAVKKGLTDSSRVCIVGASYGGYAALAAGAFTPDLYKCIVSIAGISDLKSMLYWDKSLHGKDSWILTYMMQQFTKGIDDDEAMYAVSPEHFANNFKAPVLLIHGVEDKRVTIAQSRQMNTALKKANKSVTLIELKDEDHFLSNSATRQQTLEEMIKFVNANIGH